MKYDIGIPLPDNAVTQKMAWIGTSGGGKTYGAMRLAEEMYDHRAQFVALDPVGVWYGLRLQKNGKKPSDISIPVFGGLHGDIPLESTSGKLMADLVVDKALTAILDVSQFESDAEKARFAADFANRFFFRMKAAPSAVHVFLEECQEFVPQNPQREENRMLHAFVRMQKIGRNFGIGTSLITQRPQEVSKKALNLAGTLFAFRTTGSHERKAIEAWMQDNSVEEKDIIRALPSLATGSPHVWSPEWLKISKVVHIREKRTFDASATPEVGAKAVARELGAIDLEKIRDEMQATIEKAKAEDPKVLRAEIVRLKKELQSPVPRGSVKIEQVADPKAIERAVAARDKEWDAVLKDANRLIREKNAVLDKILDITMRLETKQVKQFSAPEKLVPIILSRENLEQATLTMQGFAPQAPRLVVDKSDLSTVDQRVLDGVALAMTMTTNPTIPLIAACARYSVRTGSFIEAMRSLKEKGLIDGKRLTREGMVITKRPEAPLDTRALQDMVLDVLEGPEHKIMTVLCKNATGLDDERLAAASGYSTRTGSYIEAKRALRNKGLISDEDRIYRPAEFLI